jgi:1,2-diacylglycerol 3-alpha-glucosyltransferase
MKILACGLTYPLPNGVTVSIDLSREEMVRQGHSFHIIAPDYKEKRKWLTTLPSIPLLNRKERALSPMSERKVKKIIANFKPDIFWLHTISPFEHPFERLMGKSSVLTYHTFVENYGSMFLGEFGAEIMRTRSKNIANKMGLVISPTIAVKNMLVNYGVKTNIEIVPTGINPPTSSYTKQELAERFNFDFNKPLVIYSGRISPEKNPELLIETIKKLKEFNFLVVAPEVPFNFPNMIAIEGWPRKEVCRLYQAADLSILPSASEVQGLVIGEALSVGTRVVKVKSELQPEPYPSAKAVEKADFIPAIKQEIKKGKCEPYIFSIEDMAKKQIALFEKLRHNK